MVWEMALPKERPSRVAGTLSRVLTVTNDSAWNSRWIGPTYVHGHQRERENMNK